MKQFFWTSWPNFFRYCSNVSRLVINNKWLNALSAKPIKRSNTLKQFVVCCGVGVWKVNAETWWNPTLTRESSLTVPFTLTRLQACSYIECTTLTNHFSRPRFLKARHTTFLGTQSKAFSKSTNGKNGFFFFPKYFSCNCKLKWRLQFHILA